jgi:hypothetical protein
MPLPSTRIILHPHDVELGKAREIALVSKNDDYGCIVGFTMIDKIINNKSNVYNSKLFMCLT